MKLPFLVGLTLLLSVAACGQDGGEDQGGAGSASGRAQQAALPPPEDCPHTPGVQDFAAIWRANGVEPSPGVVPPASVSAQFAAFQAEVGATVDMPEYHDCQRFLIEESGSLTYGNVFRIYVTRVIWDQSTPAPIPGTGPVKQDYLASALIYAEADYKPLEIVAGWNCVYLWEVVPTDYRAQIAAAATGSCPATVADMTSLPGGKSLRLDKDLMNAANDKFTYADFAHAARWEWDETHQRYHIGLPCGPNWCEVGADPLYGSSPPHGADAALAARERRVRRIRGWYDEQRLALYDAALKKPIPTNVIATIFPNPWLDNFPKTVYDTTWVLAAEISITGVLPQYQTKLNLYPYSGGGPNALNRQFLCHAANARVCLEADKERIKPTGSPTTITAPTAAEVTAILSTLKNGCVMPGATDVWVARVKAAGDQAPPLYRCVERKAGMVGKSVLGAARWRWLFKDETIWEECDEGCCEVCIPGSSCF